MSLASIAPADSPDLPHRAGGRGEYLAFRLGHEEYALPILDVQEIRSYEQPTRIPSTPAFIKGVMNLRGVVVPIIDLRQAFALERADIDALTVTVILNVGERVVGAVVDAVSDVVRLEAGHIRSAPRLRGATDDGHVTGIAALEQDGRQRLLILLDVERTMRGAGMALAAAPVVH